MTTVTVQKLDDPEFSLVIDQAGDFQGWRSKAKAKEPYTFEWIKEIGNGILYDVGACVGSYSLMAAARGAKVVAFEPLPWNYAECWKNVLLNRLQERITVLPFAVTDMHGGPVSLTTVRETEAGFGLASHSVSFVVPSWRFDVPQVTLQETARIYGSPTHIKIDVEDGEIAVLRGTGPMLDSVESVIVEGQSVTKEVDLRAILEPHGLVHEWAGGKRRDTGKMHIFRRQR